MFGIDPDSQARLIYLTLLGAVLASWLVWQYRGRFGAATRHAAVWLLIVLGLVLAYGLKDDLRRQLVPGSASVVEAGTVALARGADGHFSAILTVDGARIRFVVDTGASGVVLTQRDARRIGLDPASLRYTQRASTANGVVRGAPIRLGRMELGEFVDLDVPAVVNEGELADSLLGLDYLNRFSRLAIEGDTLYLTR